MISLFTTPQLQMQFIRNKGVQQAPDMVL